MCGLCCLLIILLIVTHGKSISAVLFSLVVGVKVLVSVLEDTCIPGCCVFFALRKKDKKHHCTLAYPVFKGCPLLSPQRPPPPSKSSVKLGTMWLCHAAMTPRAASARASAGDEGRCPCPNAPTPSCPPRTAGWPSGRAPGTSCGGGCPMEMCPWPSCMLSGEMLALTAAGWRSQGGSMTTRSTYACVWRKVK